MRIRATVVKALAAGALLAGGIGVVGVTSSSALSLNNFYVSPRGTTNVNNPCTNKATPCATIAQAVSSAEAINASGPNTINVAKGKYAAAITLTSAAQDMTIVGPAGKHGKFKAVITSANPVVTVPNTSSGVTVENLGLVGNGTSDGIDVSGATNTVASVAYSVNGGSAPGTAVNASSGATVDNVTVSGTVCVDTTKSDIPANAPKGTLVELAKRTPKCAGGTLSNSAVSIGGKSETVDSAGKKDLVLDVANGSADVPAGSTVAFASTADGYTDNGVVCNGCTVENSTIDGTGLASQIGINAESNNTDTITGNTVNGNGSVGIAVEVPSSNTITVGTVASPNSGSSNGTGISVDGTLSGTGNVSVTGNSVGGVVGGIAAECVTTGAEAITGNSASATALEGTGIAILGSQHLTVSGNTTSGSLGVIVANGLIADCGTTPSTNNNISDNTVSNGLLFGVLVLGANDPVDIQAATSVMGLNPDQATYPNEPNSFSNNTWSGNSEANIVDFNGYHGQVAPACSFVVAAASIAAGSNITQVSVLEPASPSGVTCTLNAGTNLEDKSDPGHINQELYVTSAVTLIEGGSAQTVNVSNFIPLGSSQFDAPPSVGLVAGDVLYTDQSPYLNATSVTTNTYSGNSAQPHTNGSTSLDAITGSGGYYAG